MRNTRFANVLIAAAMALSVAAGVQDVAKTADAMNGVPPVADPRVRTYVAPARIVWESRPVDGGSVRFAVEGAAKLLEPCRGQIPEAGLGSPATGCRLVNKGVAPGILIDFGRELHGGVQIGLGKGPRGMRLRVRFGNIRTDDLLRLNISLRNDSRNDGSRHISKSDKSNFHI